MEKEKVFEETNINLEEIVDTYTGYLYTTIINMTRGDFSKEDIEEVISDVFFIFWKNRYKFDKNKEVKNYLVGITNNLIKEKYRKIKITYDIEDYENILINNIDVDFIYEQNEREKIIESALSKMSSEDRTIFVMYYYDSKKIKEIAENLKNSEFAIKSRLHRIRRKIKKELESEGYSYEK